MEIPPTRLNSCSEDAYLDLRTFLVFHQEPPHDNSARSEAFSLARRHHEIGHWRRVLGSTFGHLLLLQRLARDRTLLGAFGELGHRGKAAVRLRRQSGERIWSVVPPYDPALAGEAFGLSGQFWGEMYLATDSLINGMTGWRNDQVRDEIMRLSLADTWLHAIGGFPSDYLDFPKVQFHARHWLRGPCSGEPTPHGQLTTRLLLECASTMDEVLMRGEDESAEWDEIRRFGRHALVSTEYGMATEIVSQFLGPLWTIPTALALIDWALNPPLPMLEVTDRSITWREFYPPARFIDACRAVAQEWPGGGLFTGEPHEFGPFREVLAARGLRYGLVDVPLRAAYDIGFPDAREGLVAFYGPLLQASATLLLRRNTHPDLIAMPRTYIAAEVEADGDGQFARDMTPYYPFVTVEVDKIAPGFGVTTQDAANFLTGALTLVALDSAVNEYGNLGDEQIGRSLETSNFLEQAADFVHQSTGLLLETAPTQRIRRDRDN